MASKKTIDTTNIERKLKDLKIELLKQPQKRKSIKKEIARLLTSVNKAKPMKKPIQIKSGGIS